MTGQRPVAVIKKTGVLPTPFSAGFYDNFLIILKQSIDVGCHASFEENSYGHLKTWNIRPYLHFMFTTFAGSYKNNKCKIPCQTDEI